jgi:hypothetical protein
MSMGNAAIAVSNAAERHFVTEVSSHFVHQYFDCSGPSGFCEITVMIR